MLRLCGLGSLWAASGYFSAADGQLERSLLVFLSCWHSTTWDLQNQAANTVPRGQFNSRPFVFIRLSMHSACKTRSNGQSAYYRRMNARSSLLMSCRIVRHPQSSRIPLIQECLTVKMEDCERENWLNCRVDPLRPNKLWKRLVGTGEHLLLAGFKDRMSVQQSCHQHVVGTG